MLLQLLLSPKNTSCLDDSSGDKSGTSIHLPAGTKDSSGGQRRPLLTAHFEPLHQAGFTQNIKLPSKCTNISLIFFSEFKTFIFLNTFTF